MGRGEKERERERKGEAGAGCVIFIVQANGHVDQSSNPGQDCGPFHIALWESFASN